MTPRTSVLWRPFNSSDITDSNCVPRLRAIFTRRCFTVFPSSSPYCPIRTCYAKEATVWTTTKRTYLNDQRGPFPSQRSLSSWQQIPNRLCSLRNGSREMVPLLFKYVLGYFCLFHPTGWQLGNIFTPHRCFRRFHVYSRVFPIRCLRIWVFFLGIFVRDNSNWGCLFIHLISCENKY